VTASPLTPVQVRLLRTEKSQEVLVRPLVIGPRRPSKDRPPVVRLSRLAGLGVDDAFLPVEPVSLGVGLGGASGIEPGVLGEIRMDEKRQDEGEVASATRLCCSSEWEGRPERT
jgi:hypothetical protein